MPPPDSASTPTFRDASALTTLAARSRLKLTTSTRLARHTSTAQETRDARLFQFQTTTEMSTALSTAAN
jgi:hypothetical protein